MLVTIVEFSNDGKRLKAARVPKIIKSVDRPADIEQHRAPSHPRLARKCRRIAIHRSASRPLPRRKTRRTTSSAGRTSPTAQSRATCTQCTSQTQCTTTAMHCLWLAVDTPGR